MRATRMLILCIFVPLSISGCALSKIPNTDVFGNTEIYKYLQPFSAKGDWLNDNNVVSGYWQDSKGRTVYIPGEKYMYALMQGRNDPLRIPYPSSSPSFVRHFWIDDNHQLQYLPAYALDEGDANVWTEVDRQSGYFFQWKRDSSLVNIGHMDNHESWLFSLTMDGFSPSQICARGKIIYLLDHRQYDIPPSLFNRKNCRAYEPDPLDPKHFIMIEEFALPGRVKVVDPFSPRAVCDGYGVMPVPGYPFIFDLQQHRVISRLPNDSMVLFLDRDWLTPRLNRN
jgi:hypothetical protein